MNENEPVESGCASTFILAIGAAALSCVSAVLFFFCAFALIVGMREPPPRELALDRHRWESYSDGRFFARSTHGIREERSAMAQVTPDACPDCKGSLQLITLGNNNAAKDTTMVGMELGYITARFDMSGTVKAFRCDRCARIFLYGYNAGQAVPGRTA